MAQQITAAKKLLLFPGFQIGAFQFVDLIAQRIYTARFLRFVHLQGLHPAPQGNKCLIFGAVILQQHLRAAETVQVDLMLFFIQKLLSVMLAMDIQQTVAQRAKLCHCHRPAVDTADILAVGMDFTLQKQLLFRFNAQIVANPRLYIRKAGADKRFLSAGADQVAGSTLAQHGAQRVDHDRLTGACFTGKGIKTGFENNIRLLNDGNIFDVK